MGQQVAVFTVRSGQLAGCDHAVDENVGREPDYQVIESGRDAMTDKVIVIVVGGSSSDHCGMRGHLRKQPWKLSMRWGVGREEVMWEMVMMMDKR